MSVVPRVQKPVGASARRGGPADVSRDRIDGPTGE
jgi:hypothetical protein